MLVNDQVIVILSIVMSLHYQNRSTICYGLATMVRLEVGDREGEGRGRGRRDA